MSGRLRLTPDLLSPQLARHGQTSKQISVYYGQGDSQPRLNHFCDDTDIDIIPIGFVNGFPNKAGNGGYPSVNFGNQCGGDFYPGTQMYKSCLYLKDDVQYCQDKGKKVVLSIGGDPAYGSYSLNSDTEGRDFASQLWQMFGPVPAGWTGPRPFGNSVVDGFDFDIEGGGGVGYGAMAEALRGYMNADTKKSGYLLTAAPQCIVPDTNLADALTKTNFDYLFVQFYNTPKCSARAHLDHTYGGSDTDISFNTWSSWLDTNVEYAAKPQIFIGLPGATDKANDAYMYLSQSDAQLVFKDFCSNPKFGGVMIWEATAAEANNKYVSQIRSAIGSACGASTTTTSTTTTRSSTSTTSSSSASTTSSSASTTSSSASTTKSTTSSSSTTPAVTTTASSSTTKSSSTTSSANSVTTSLTTSSSSSNAPATTSSSTTSKLTTTSSTTQILSTTSSTTKFSSMTTSNSLVGTSSTPGFSSTTSSQSTTKSTTSSNAIQTSSTTSSRQATTTIRSTTVSSSTGEITTAYTTSTSRAQEVATTTSNSRSETSATTVSIPRPPLGNGTVTTSSGSSTISSVKATTSSSVEQAWGPWSTSASTSRSPDPTSSNTQQSWSIWSTMSSSTTSSRSANPTTSSSVEHTWALWSTSSSSTSKTVDPTSTWAPWTSPTASNVYVTSTVTTYIDICPTGFTTLTATVTATITLTSGTGKPTGSNAPWPTGSAGVPTGFYATTKIYTSSTVTSTVYLTVPVPTGAITKTVMPTASASTPVEATSGKPSSIGASSTGSANAYAGANPIGGYSANGVKTYTGGAAEQAPSTAFSIVACVVLAAVGLIL